MTTENRPDFVRLITVGALILIFIFVIGALRARERPFFRIGAVTTETQETLPDTVKRRDELQRDRWHKGFRLLRYWWTGGAAVYVAEMDRSAENLQFDIELANNQILGRETITDATRRLNRERREPVGGGQREFRDPGGQPRTWGYDF